MYTLGINAVFHDSAACIFKDGILLGAAEEERFTGIKHGKRPIPFSTYELPFHAIAYCLDLAGIHLKEISHVAYSFNPYLLLPEDQTDSPVTTIPFQPLQSHGMKENLWDHLFLSYVMNAPDQLADGYPHHLQKWFKGSRSTDWVWHFVEHHTAHAASAFYPSPYREAAVMTLDGRGELATTTYNIGHQNELSRCSEVLMPHSLGLLYENVTSYLGFLHSSDEYKVMALASYGKPEFINDFRDIIRLGAHGQYRITNERLEERFGPARNRADDFTPHHFNIAHSLQYVLEETVLDICSWLHQETRQQQLCLAGGVALNCVLNAKIKERSSFKNVWVQPAAGDSGTALGAAMWVNQQQNKHQQRQYLMDHAYLGPEYTDHEIEKFLNWTKTPYTKMEDVALETARLLAEDQIIGWFQGRMEFGPRALGSRSILASPINPEMQARLNEVKDREDFRPVAPVVLEEEAAKWFLNADQSPFMLFVYQVREDKAGKIPAVKHIDGTARIQTINPQQHPVYHALLKAFQSITGVPVLVNTSFNTLGKPIVCSPRDAVTCFWSSPFDALVIGSFLIQKKHANKNISSYTYFQKAEIID